MPEISHEFKLLKQDIDLKHVRVQKVMELHAQQTAGQLIQSVQQQLRTMQSAIIAAIEAGAGSSAVAHISTGENYLQKQLNSINALADDDCESLGEIDDTHYARGNSGYEDSDDEDFNQLRVAGNGALRKAGAAGEKGKEAWAKKLALKDQKRRHSEGVNEVKEVAGIQEALAINRQVRDETKGDDAMASWRIHARKIVFAPRFEIAVSVILAVCAAVIGAEAHWGMHELNQEEFVFFRVMNVTFNILFTGELILRVAADSLFFISRFNPALWWNVLDILLVVIALVEELLLGIGRSVFLTDGGILRLVRMLRLVRILRIFRMVRFFIDLRIMVKGMQASARALFWALLLMLLFIYMYGVTFMQLSRTFLTLNDGNDVDADTIALFRMYYGGLGKTVLTLFMTITGGILWKDAAEPLSRIHWLLEPVFASYVFFAVFCALNIINAIFVDNAQASKRTDETIIRRDWIRENRRWIVDVADLYSKVTQNRDTGELTRDDFEKTIQSDRVQTLLRKLGISLEGCSVGELWDLFDPEEKGSIIQSDFAQGIRQFQGQARSLDVAKLKRDTQVMDSKLDEILRHWKVDTSKMRRHSPGQLKVI
eukprot:CAMPEP_0197639776 /NCGR_PEP_ID=MMETSP1338-20131121/14298_1 /TAXON_ID=43686 ORGANISM="Pelagodinium beii, Strain RCC1491" /NCGR_SAMPLE_ID=MMETSP1338 /ASSEMBLY_ACC=CAM_ASM_000754 /LENGTH=597 /DNA_ID=CAMNT_0043212549 /DNA_START=23 /DNA_END=1814 /DNA_ORIENTATION=+